MSDTTNTTSGPRYVKIRTAYGWVKVPTVEGSSSIDRAALEAEIEKLRLEMQGKLDEKLDKSAWIGKSLIDEIFKNSSSISNDFGDNTTNGGN